MVQPESGIYDLRRRVNKLEKSSWKNLKQRLEFLESEQDLAEKFQSRYEEIRGRSELERLESRLEMLEKQQDLVEKFQTEFEETRFVAAAWA